MHGDIQEKPDLLIVSDTAMWQTTNGNIAFEPVVREIEDFYPLFNKITWIGFRYPEAMISDNATALKKAKVDFIFLEHIGGGEIVNRLKMLFQLPVHFFTILKHIKKNGVIHARGPSLPAYFTLWIARFFKKPIYWYKYAGNWELETAPASYIRQRNFLKKLPHVIGTINGHWQGQQSHLLTFENPCFTKSELEIAKTVARKKDFEERLNLLFVGRLEKMKGFDRLIDALSEFGEDDGLGTIYFVGGGEETEKYKELAAETLKVDYEFTGALKREALNELYKKSHIFCLPSLSEGFPKVLAESAAFGCVPIVSDISCIGQYILHEENGFLLKDISSEEIVWSIRQLLNDRVKAKSYSVAVNKIADNFTYEHYTERIQNNILKV